MIHSNAKVRFIAFNNVPKGLKDHNDDNKAYNTNNPKKNSGAPLRRGAINSLLDTRIRERK
jgi:hypothetical protein